MKRSRKAAVVVTSVLAVALLGWGTVAGAGEGMGVIVREGAAAISVQDQETMGDAFVVDQVIAPEDAFVVVHMDEDGMPGERVGAASVRKGVSTDIEVELDGAMGATDVLVALHADRGTPGELDFDMDDMEHSPDKPYFVDGMEVAVGVRLR